MSKQITDEIIKSLKKCPYCYSLPRGRVSQHKAGKKYFAVISCSNSSSSTQGHHCRTYGRSETEEEAIALAKEMWQSQGEVMTPDGKCHSIADCSECPDEDKCYSPEKENNNEEL